MQPSRDQVVHDLAMACVNGVVMAKVMEESKDSYPCVSAMDLAADALIAYKEAYRMIDGGLGITAM